MSIEKIEILRLKLKEPKKSRTDEWFDEIGKLVNLIYVDFLNHESDEIAIHSLALIRLAAKEGSKDAKNKVIKLTRWLRETPPSICKNISSKDEQKLLIKDFSILKSEWVSGYIFEEIKLCSKIQLNDYLEWLLKYSNSLIKFVDFLNIEYKKHKYEITKEKELLILDFLMKKNLISGESFSAMELGYLAQFFQEQLLKEVNLKDKELIALKQYEIIHNIIYLQPNIFLERSFLALLEIVRSNIESKSVKLSKSLNRVATRIASLINLGVQSSKDNLFDIYKNYLNYFTTNVPKFKDELKQEQYFFLNNVFDNKENPKEKVLENIDSLFISLFASWREIKGSGIDEMLIENFENYLHELANVHSIILVGKIDQECQYEPLKHQLIDDGNEFVEYVRIKIPGIGKLREDGSFRVISKAIAERY